MRILKPIPQEELVSQLNTLGVRKNGVLVVHASFRSVRPIEGGPLGLIQALESVLGNEGTLVMPTMTNGESLFDPRVTPTSDMGIIAELFWRQPGVIRSTHPGASFAAKGPLAKDICRPQPLSPPHGPDSPIGRVYDHDGQILLLGVTHGENTTLHLAETISNVPYSISHPCVVEMDGVAKTVMIPETDHCCKRFLLAGNWLQERNLQREGNVGNATAILCNAKDVVLVTVDYLKQEPLIFLCPSKAGCKECDLARKSLNHAK